MGPRIFGQAALLEVCQGHCWSHKVHLPHGTWPSPPHTIGGAPQGVWVSHVMLRTGMREGWGVGMGREQVCKITAVFPKLYVQWVFCVK